METGGSIRTIQFDGRKDEGRGRLGAARGGGAVSETQLADGSWYVHSHALGIQPYFESGFPHGRDQFISATATNWATQALVLAGR